MNNLRKILLVICLLGGWIPKLLGNGFSLPDQDAFATGRGEAFVATANNPSAIYYNPAGISQLDDNNLRGGFYGIYYNPSYSPPNSGNTYHSSFDLAAIPQLFYTHTFTNSMLSLGLGVYAPFGGNIDWPQNTGFSTVATQGKLTYLTINPAVSLKLAPGLSVGGGVMVNYVKMYFEQGLSTSPFPNFYQFKGDDWSVGYNLGALWKPINQISFGASFRSSAEANLRGQSQFEELSARIPYTTLPAAMDLTFPLTAVVGASYRPTPKWNLEFDANYTAWSSFGQTAINQGGTAPFGINQDIAVNLNWQDSWIYEVGVTRYLGSNWHISAGYAFNQNSVPNNNYTPLAADLNRDLFSIGAGFKSENFNFDLAYQFGYGPSHTVTGSAPSSEPGNFAGQSANGKYGFTSDALIVTVGIHF